MAFFVISFAQSGTVEIFDGKIIRGDFFKEKLYLFDSYKSGRIKVKDGIILYGDLNINLLEQAVKVITDTKDTIYLKMERDIESVSAGNSLFLKLNNHYIQIMNVAEVLFLGLERTLKIGQEKVEGAYGGSTEASSVTKVSSYVLEGRLEKIVGSRTLKYDYTERLYLVKKGKLYPATQKSFQKFFSDNKKEIELYVKENNIKFNRNEDIVQLFNYLVNKR